jgi:hypothetical protein
MNQGLKGFLFGLACFVGLIVIAGKGCNTVHHAKIYKLKNHHIVMKDDRGKWWEYTLKGVDIDFDIPWADTGNFTPRLPAGGSWRAATQEEEEEVTVDNEAASEDVSVGETDAGTPDGDVGAEGGGGDSGGDGGDGGGDGGE